MKKVFKQMVSLMLAVTMVAASIMPANVLATDYDDVMDGVQAADVAETEPDVEEKAEGNEETEANEEAEINEKDGEDKNAEVNERVEINEETGENEEIAAEKEIEKKEESVSESDKEPAEFTYQMQNSKLTITGYNGKETSVIIPSTIDGYEVTAIGENAFKENDSLASIEIPDSVKNIEENAFGGCNKITDIILGEGLEHIYCDKDGEKSAFNDCAEVKSIYFSGNAREDGNYRDGSAIAASAFRDNTASVSIMMPDSVTSIGGYAFYNCCPAAQSLSRIRSR